MKYKAIIASMLLLASASAGAQTTQRLSASKASEYGLIYNLPRTVLDITIEAEYTQKRPGEFYNYANRYLGISDAITEPSDAVTIKSVTLVPRGVADADNQWLVQFKSGSTPFMILDESGCILSVNTEATAPTASVQLPQAQAAAPTPLETAAARQAVTQEMTLSSSIGKKAELAAQRIFELRETRADLLSGQADNTPPDGKSMELMLDNLSAQEAALTAMFEGTTRHFTTVETITIEPDSVDMPDLMIARLSALDGVVDVDDLSGAPITLSISILDQGRLPVNERGEVKKFPKGGLAYRIPGKALVTIQYEGRTIFTQEVSLAQAGVTFGLDPALFADRKAPASVVFNPTTGAIVRLDQAQQ